MTAPPRRDHEAHPLRYGLRDRRLAAVIAGVVTVGFFAFVPSAEASTFRHALNCQPESFPPAGTPRNSPGAPYQAQFSASLNGGILPIAVKGALLGVTLGPAEPGYPSGTLFGDSCGLLNLPSLVGPIAGNPYGDAASGNPDYNNNFILHGPPVAGNTMQQNENLPIPVALTLAGTNVSVLQGTGSAGGAINTQILPAEAANGGFNVAFTTSAKSTASLSVSALQGLVNLLSPAAGSVLGLLQGPLDAMAPGGMSECTIVIGDERKLGLPANEIGPYTTPALLSTAVAHGTPITGPLTGASGTAYGGTFVIPPISPDMPPDPAAPGADTTPPSKLCSPTIAKTLNALFGITNGDPPGSASFTAPITFTAHETQ